MLGTQTAACPTAGYLTFCLEHRLPPGAWIRRPAYVKFLIPQFPFANVVAMAVTKIDTPGEWMKAAQLNGLSGGTIFDLEKYESGSNIDFRQFLHLRALYISKDARALYEPNCRQTWLAASYLVKAGALLRALGCWKLYLRSFKKTETQLLAEPFPDLGTFSLVRLQQLEVENSSAREDFTPKFTPIAHRTRSKGINRQRDHFQAPESPTPMPKVPPRNQIPFRHLSDAFRTCL